MFDHHLCTGGGCICEHGRGCIERGERDVSLKQYVLTLGVREKAKILFRPLSRIGERWGLGYSGERVLESMGPRVPQTEVVQGGSNQQGPPARRITQTWPRGGR